ncbi:MAG: enoyl-CoA hydratase-related protein [Pseudomonadota bacterium]
MTYQDIEVERDGPVTIIRFNRPEQRNCVRLQTHHELVDAWSRFRDDPEATVAIITGAGDQAFCAGGDLKNDVNLAAPGERMDGAPPPPSVLASHERGAEPGVLGPTRWTDIYKPIIAAVNGVAYAGGLEWACFADIRIADAHASFGVTCRRWNIGLADGGSQRLPRILGMGRAMELMITGRVIDAAEAERIGLVNEVTPKGEALARARELAAFIAALPQPAIRSDKEAAMRGYGSPLDEGLRIEAQCFHRSFFQPETQEGLRRFRERDHPDRRPGAGQTPGIVRG